MPVTVHCGAGSQRVSVPSTGVPPASADAGDDAQPALGQFVDLVVSPIHASSTAPVVTG